MSTDTADDSERPGQRPVVVLSTHNADAKYHRPSRTCLMRPACMESREGAKIPREAAEQRGFSACSWCFPSGDLEVGK